MAEADAATALLADKIAIRELLERYADAVIRKDGDIWRATWSQSAEWHIGGTVIQGVEAIAARWTGRMAEFDRVVMRISVGAIDIDGAMATARSYTSETFTQGGLAQPEVVGRYDDLLRREAAGWRFVRRLFSRLT